MKKKHVVNDDAVKLRKKAEALLLKKDILPAGVLEESSEQTLDLIHELSVHQIELEIQNEELRAVQSELEASKLRYADLYDYAPVGYITLSEKGVILDANLKVCKMLGDERRNVLNEHLTKYIYYEDQDEYYLKHDLVFKHSKHQTCELRLHGKNKSVFWARLECVSVSEDEVLLNRVIISDITDKKNIELALTESEDKFRYIFENSTVAKSFTLPSGEISVNVAFCNMLGYTKDELISGKWQNISHPDDVEISQKEVDKLINGQSDHVRFIKRYLKKDGSIVWADVFSSVRRNTEGKVVYFLTSVIDITERKKIEDAIRESEEKYRLLVTQMSQGLAVHEIVLDDSGKAINYRFIDVNRSFETITGLKGSDIVGKTVLEVLPEIENFWINNYGRVVLTGEPITFEGYSEPLNKYFEVTAYAIKKNQFAAVITDISERKESEKNRMILEEQLRNQQKLEAVGMLASGVAHEINNPLNGIMNYGQIISDAKTEDLDIKNYAKEIVNETNRISSIVKNLLAFSRQSALEYAYVNFEEVILQTLFLVNTMLKHDNIKLNVNIAKNLPEIKCYSQRIQQVVLNLIANAHDAVVEKYPENDINKVVNLSCNQMKIHGRDWLRLVVEDFGTGITEDIKDKIFNNFFTTKNQGTGLGLSISKKIIEEHHGKISVESKLNEYTRFIILLPCD